MTTAEADKTNKHRIRIFTITRNTITFQLQEKKEDGSKKMLENEEILIS